MKKKKIMLLSLHVLSLIIFEIVGYIILKIKNPFVKAPNKNSKKCFKKAPTMPNSKTTIILIHIIQIRKHKRNKFECNQDVCVFFFVDFLRVVFFLAFAILTPLSTYLSLFPK